MSATDPVCDSTWCRGIWLPTKEQPSSLAQRIILGFSEQTGSFVQCLGQWRRGRERLENADLEGHQESRVLGMAPAEPFKAHRTFKSF